MMMAKRQSATVLYARVSTADQTLEHQKGQAEAAGFVIDRVVEDHGTSGISTTLRERPQGRRLFDILRAGDTLVVGWVDRLGRNYGDVCDTIKEFMKHGVIVRTVIHGMVFDGATKDPMSKAVRDALIGFMAATAEAQAEATKAAQRAGIAYAKAGVDNPYRGRKPSYTRKQFEAVRNMLALSTPVAQIAKETGLSRQTIYRISEDPAASEGALTTWGL
jgi:DNA invertase Pin-like site-specific DNA recombinase